MTYFLDADICIFALRGESKNIEKHLRQCSPHQVKIPAIVKAELLLGVQKSKNPRKILPVIAAFLKPFDIVPFCDNCTVSYAFLRYRLELKGSLIGPNDLLIASTAMTHQATLVTHNTKEYKRIAGLKIADWTG
jgi:tRNA(fMet)-specific endonuclease VapC